MTPSKVASADDSQADRAGSSLQPWKTALAVILPVLAMALLAYQVCWLPVCLEGWGGRKGHGAQIRQLFGKTTCVPTGLATHSLLYGSGQDMSHKMHAHKGSQIRSH